MSRRRSRLVRWAWWKLPAPARERLRALRFAAQGALVARRKRRHAGSRAPRPGIAAAPLRVRSSVSVIVPTLDAGPPFRRVLESLRAQSGVGEVEIVVLDSGSRDGTRALAAAAGALVVEIAPGSFDHGLTRDLGAARASGEVLVMLAQDALPLGREGLAALAQELEADSSLAAVSARQVPRSDADLYACYVMLSHELLMRRARDGAAAGTPAGRRAAAAVDDVCTAIRRQAWEQLRFRELAFAEDLDFGLRAVARGWRVAVSERAAVAHSHTRDAVYSLRRSAADRLLLAPLVGDEQTVRAAQHEPAAVLAGGRLLVEELAGASTALGSQAQSLDVQLRGLGRALGPGSRAAPRPPELAALADFLAAGAGAEAEPCAALLRDDLVALFGWPPMRAFARPYVAVQAGEVLSFAAKLAGAVIGRAAGEAARRAGDEATATRLREGV